MLVTKENYEKFIYYFLAHKDYGKFRLFAIRGGYYEINVPDGHTCIFFLNQKDNGDMEICWFDNMDKHSHHVSHFKKFEEVLIQIHAWTYPILGDMHVMRFSSFDWDNLITYGNIMGGLKTNFERFIDARNSELCN